MFHSVYYASVCCSVYCLCVNVYWTTVTGISGHFSTTLPEVFPKLLGKYQGITRKDGARTVLPNFFPLLLLCMIRSVYYLCVNVLYRCHRDIGELFDYPN
jgi:hypothetical protein